MTVITTKYVHSLPGVEGTTTTPHTMTGDTNVGGVQVEEKKEEQYSKKEYMDFTKTEEGRQKVILLGACIGDALALVPPYELLRSNVMGSYCSKVEGGWPQRYVKNCRATDDTQQALLLAKTYKKSENNFLNPNLFSDELIGWMEKKPQEISRFTLKSLQLARFLRNKKIEGIPSDIDEDQNGVKNGDYQSVLYASRLIFERDSESSMVNGALMRNAAIASLTLGESTMDAIENTVCHCIITHFHPIAVLGCVIHTLFIRMGSNNSMEQNYNMISFQTIQNFVQNEWNEWKNSKKGDDDVNSITATWLNYFEPQELILHENQFLKEIGDFVEFDPYHHDYTGVFHQHNCSLITLKIALWCLCQSYKNPSSSSMDPPNYSTSLSSPSWLPEWPFKMNKFETIVRIPLIGQDCHSYGAVAGSLLASFYPHCIPKQLIDELPCAEEVNQLFS